MAALKTWPKKDPQETLKYGFNWSPRNIGEAKITAATTQIVSGSASLSVAATTYGDVQGSRPGQGTMHTFAGGANGDTAQILLTATLNDGQVLQQTVYLPIGDK